MVTSRNVYSWKLGGNPTRWSSTPLVLAGGQPVEVWFDQPRSALIAAADRIGATAQAADRVVGSEQAVRRQSCERGGETELAMGRQTTAPRLTRCGGAGSTVARGSCCTVRSAICW
jgi:hypothetical protein